MATPKRKVLVVDDDAEIVGMVTLGLAHAGLEVLSARDGEEGLYLARASKPDVMLLDLSMPQMNGYEVCKRLREDSGTASIKVIVASGKTYSVDVRSAKSLGADAYIVKPYGLKQILESIDSLFQGAA